MKKKWRRGRKKKEGKKKEVKRRKLGEKMESKGRRRRNKGIQVEQILKTCWRRKMEEKKNTSI